MPEITKYQKHTPVRVGDVVRVNMPRLSVVGNVISCAAYGVLDATQSEAMYTYYLEVKWGERGYLYWKQDEDGGTFEVVAQPLPYRIELIGNQVVAKCENAVLVSMRASHTANDVCGDNTGLSYKYLCERGKLVVVDDKRGGFNFRARV